MKVQFVVKTFTSQVININKSKSHHFVTNEKIFQNRLIVKSKTNIFID